MGWVKHIVLGNALLIAIYICYTLFLGASIPSSIPKDGENGGVTFQRESSSAIDDALSQRHAHPHRQRVYHAKNNDNHPVSAAATAASSGPESKLQAPDMNMATCCPTNLPGVLDTSYVPKGSISQIDGADVYFAGSPGSKGIIHVYDIFGLTSQAKQVADTLALAGFYVAMPDFFRGEPWELNNFPPPDRNAFMSFINGKGDYETSIKPLMVNVRDKMKADGVEKFGILGFCWGGGAMVNAINDDLGVCGATCHPAFITAEMATTIHVPVCVLSSKDDTALVDTVKPIVEAKPFWDQCVFKNFPEMHHGWVQGRGDWSDPKQAEQAAEAVKIVADFFTKNIV